MIDGHGVTIVALQQQESRYRMQLRDESFGERQWL